MAGAVCHGPECLGPRLNHPDIWRAIVCPGRSASGERGPGAVALHSLGKRLSRRDAGVCGLAGPDALDGVEERRDLWGGDPGLEEDRQLRDHPGQPVADGLGVEAATEGFENQVAVPFGAGVGELVDPLGDDGIVDGGLVEAEELVEGVEVAIAGPAEQVGRVLAVEQPAGEPDAEVELAGGGGQQRLEFLFVAIGFCFGFDLREHGPEHGVIGREGDPHEQPDDVFLLSLIELGDFGANLVLGYTRQAAEVVQIGVHHLGWESECIAQC